MDEITTLSFVGIYILLLGGFVYNFYLSKKIYKVLELMVEIMDRTSNVKDPQQDKKKKDQIIKDFGLK